MSLRARFHQPRELITLQFKYVNKFGGDVIVYELPSAFAAMWRDLNECYRRRHPSKDAVQPPYRSLITALRAISGTCVQIWLPNPDEQNSPKLISRSPLRADDLHDAFRFWVEAFDGKETPWHALATYAASAVPDQRPIVSFIERHGHQPDAPGWVYDLAVWELMARLASVPFRTRDYEIRLRQTTDGSLVCWDSPWPSAQNDDRRPPRYAMARIDGALKTSPYLHSPIIVLDGYASRLADRWDRVASVYLAPPDSSKPILVAELDGPRTHRRLNTYVVEVARRLQAQALIHPMATLPRFPEELGGIHLDGPPGDIRALVPRSIESPHGSGMGMEFYRRLYEHIVAVVPELEECRVRYVETGMRFRSRRSPQGLDDSSRKRMTKHFREAIFPSELAATVVASGVRLLRIVCLYTTVETRSRMVATLRKRLSMDSTFNPPDDHEVHLEAFAVSVIFHCARRFLAAGAQIDRDELMNDMPGLDVAVGTRAVAWCETDYDPERRFASVEEQRIFEAEDAKFHVRRALAGRQITCQFVAHREVVDPSILKRRARSKAQREQLEREKVEPEDFAAQRALSDLMRGAGLMDARIGWAIGVKDTVPIWHVGLHIRRQNPPRHKRWTKPRHTVALVAIRPIGGVNDPWEVLAYQPGAAASRTAAAGAGWVSYAQATAAFHAAPLVEGKLGDFGREEMAAYVRNALAQLRQPYVVYVNASPGRGVWRGLQNVRLDGNPTGDQRGMWLPGLDLPESQRPLAVVRINHARDEIGKPVGVRRGASWQATTRSLFQKVSDGPHTTWLLSTIPRGYLESTRHRPGERATRWDVQAHDRRHVMYSHTGTEIFPIGIRDGDRERYAMIAAKLIDQAPYHDFRVIHPAPLHLARLMDEDHPQYRRTVDDEHLGDASSAARL